MQHGQTAAAVQRDGGPSPLIVAHRGAWQHAPQNSLEAARRAAALGCDGIEIDVRRTADGRIVLVHDARVRWRPVGRLDHRQVLVRVQVGQAPLLADILEQAAGRLLVDVELKEPGYVADVMALVQPRVLPHQYVITSFRPAVLAEVKRHCPDARTGLLVSPLSIRQTGRRLQVSAADFIAPHFSLAWAGILDWAAARNLTCWVWTVNDLRSLQALSAHPAVAALITDAPAEALALAPAGSHPVDLAESRE